MKTLQQFLIVTGAFLLAYNGAMLVHELGHAIAVTATGGRVSHITMSPLSWSLTHYGIVFEPRAAAWGGFLFGSAVPLLLALVAWCLRSRLSLWAMMLAVVALVSNGVYMIVGAATGTGDSATLIRLGLSPGALYTCGAVLVAVGLPLALPLGALLGVGRGRTRLPVTLLVIGLPILVYQGTIVAFNLTVNPQEWRTWTMAIGGGSALTIILAGALHLAAPWADGPETARRALPIGWGTVLVSLAAGAAIILVELLLFS